MRSNSHEMALSYGSRPSWTLLRGCNDREENGEREREQRIVMGGGILLGRGRGGLGSEVSKATLELTLARMFGSIQHRC